MARFVKKCDSNQVVSLLLTACTDAAFKALNALSYVLNSQKLEQNLAYGEKPYQKLDLYLPKDPSTATGQLIVFIYGGSWTSGAKERYYFVADALTSAGYAVAIPDYIKYPQGAFPSFVQDIALSIAWLTRHVSQYTTVNEFIIMGHSAGAHTGALLITDPKYLAAHQLKPNIIHAFVGLAGPYGFTPKGKQYRDVFTNLEDYRQMQPLYFATGHEPPMLLLHGNDDTTVLPVNTRRFAQKVNDHGGTAVTCFYDGRGHIDIMLAFSRIFGSENAIRTNVLDFLQRRAENRPESLL
jgi:acetyl esterase/lipase